MVKCSACGKRFNGTISRLKETHPLKNHIRDKHHGKAIPELYEPPEHEESMAERHIQATLDEAMGIPNFDREWLI